MAAATAAAAGEIVAKGSMHFVAAEIPLVECADGTRVGLGFHVTYTQHEYTSSAGDLTRLRTNMQYDGYVENLSTGATADFGHGARTVTFDLVNGTSTSNGNLRTFTVRGSGSVLKMTGHEVWDLDTGLALTLRGPKVDEVTNPWVPCQALGLDGGALLPPPQIPEH